jgi:hypothetical protein
MRSYGVLQHREQSRISGQDTLELQMGDAFHAEFKKIFGGRVGVSQSQFPVNNEHGGRKQIEPRERLGKKTACHENGVCLKASSAPSIWRGP